MYCEQCKVSILGTKTICPLCQNKVIVHNKKENIFPEIPTILEKHNFLFKTLMSLSIITGIISLFVNYLMKINVWWSLFVILGIISVWACVTTAIKKRNNLSKAIFYQALLLMILALTWDFTTGWHGWSIDYVLPIIATATLLGFASINIVMNTKPTSTIIYFLIICLIGIIPFIFLTTNTVNVNYPSIISVITTTIFLSTMIIFNGKEMLEELKKRLHI